MKNIILGITFAFNAMTSFAEHSIKYEVSPLGNLIYQLDCMAQVARFRCSQSDFSNLWLSKLNSEANDDAIMIDKWRLLRSKLDKNVEFEPSGGIQMATSPNYPVNASNSLNVLEQVRIMAFASKNFENYKKLAGFVLSQNHLNDELIIINHFQDRFNSWFVQQKDGLEKFVDEANKLSTKHDINGLLSDMRIFYHSELPDSMVLPVYLVAHPEKSAFSSGLVFNENSIIEVLKGEKAASRLGVVIHEIAHFYHERANESWHQHVMDYFTGKSSMTGKVGYYLFNEAIASAIGNGILEQRMNTPEYFQKSRDYPMSFYADEGIDLAAKASMPLVKNYINNSKASNDDFLSKLDTVWSKSLKDIIKTPKQRLRHSGVVILDDSLNVLINDIFALVRPSSAQINNVEDLQNGDELIINQYPALDSIILAKSWEQLDALKLSGLKPINNNINGMQTLKLKGGTVYLIFVSESKDYILKELELILNRSSF